MRLILLRHGLTEANERHLYFGSTDLPLSERGREALRRSDRVLPPVQDATPDAPVLPTNVILPAVQDAHALPKTGVNWLAAIGLALSGFCLMAGGAWASLTGKNAKH